MKLHLQYEEMFRISLLLCLATAAGVDRPVSLVVETTDAFRAPRCVSTPGDVKVCSRSERQVPLKVLRFDA